MGSQSKKPEEDPPDFDFSTHHHVTLELNVLKEDVQEPKVTIDSTLFDQVEAHKRSMKDKRTQLRNSAFWDSIDPVKRLTANGRVSYKLQASQG